MKEKSAALLARIERFRAQTDALSTGNAPSGLVGRMFRRLTLASAALEKSYKSACVAGWGDSFLLHLSTAAREAKRARKLLLDLTQLGYLDIDVTREPMLEARGIENILSASRNTLRRRRAERARTAHDGSH